MAMTEDEIILHLTRVKIRKILTKHMESYAEILRLRTKMHTIESEYVRILTMLLEITRELSKAPEGAEQGN